MIAMLQETGKSLFDLCLGVVHYSVVHLGSWGALLLLGLLPLHINLLIVFVKRISITKSRLARWSLLPVFALSLLLSFLVFAAAWANRAWGPVELRPDLDASDVAQRRLAGGPHGGGGEPVEAGGGVRIRLPEPADGGGGARNFFGTFRTHAIDSELFGHTQSASYK